MRLLSLRLNGRARRIRLGVIGHQLEFCKPSLERSCRGSRVRWFRVDEQDSEDAGSIFFLYSL
jgi:hypothetical protein